MRQLTFVNPGVLEWWDVPEPTLQGAEEAIVRPLAVARCDLDVAILSGQAPVAGPFPVGQRADPIPISSTRPAASGTKRARSAASASFRITRSIMRGRMYVS
jgi:hypothetical protein